MDECSVVWYVCGTIINLVTRTQRRNGIEVGAHYYLFGFKIRGIEELKWKKYQEPRRRILSE